MYLTQLALLMALLSTASPAEKPDYTFHFISAWTYKGLPIEIREYLKKRDCYIPQSFTMDETHNVIQGHFMNDKTIDWAVLCSQDIYTVIFVFPSGGAKRVYKFAESKIDNHLQAIDGKATMGYSRIISQAAAKFIIEKQNRANQPLSFEITHDGIDDAFAEKGSVVHYWHNGKWLTLHGSD